MDLTTLTNKLGGFLSTGLADLLFERNTDFIERRAYTRLKFRFKAFLDVNGHRFQVRGIDLHRGGAGIVSESPLPIGALTFVYAKPHGLMGWATVRWCSRSSSQYHMGLEFRSPLMRAEVGTWQFSRVPPNHGAEAVLWR